MNESCGGPVERLPEWVAGRLEEKEAATVRAHVEACPRCADEVDVLRVIALGRAEPPAGLADRIQAAVRTETADRITTRGPGTTRSESHPGMRPPRLHRLRRAWALSAAAVVVLALGTALLQHGDAGDALALGEIPVEENSGVWTGTEVEVAGAPIFDDLSDDVLASLLEEMGG